MDRVEKVREVVDNILLNMTDVVERRCAYIHLYGVAQACAMLAMKRGADIELAVVAGMLHDIYSYVTMDSLDHVHKSAGMSRDILEKVGAFSKDEIEKVCEAIYNHSDKDKMQGTLDEILKDADVMQHCLYNPLFPIKEHEKLRWEKLKVEMGMVLIPVSVLPGGKV